MFEDSRGRYVTSVEEAEDYIWRFIAENLSTEDHRIRDRSQDYDLYLPWLLEILEYQKADRNEAPPILDIQHLYMEASWDLVMRGLLRPGPRTISGDPLRDGYGKGYSLTDRGQRQLGEFKRAIYLSSK
ncbi:MAG TPA: hypothetical protein VMI31_13070 [Fimbriimonadaceae bacterium]|nr:hypothetical protein [Fimbriimonadaceae bacterium]